MLEAIFQQRPLPQSGTSGSQPGSEHPAIPWKPPTLAEAVAVQGAVDTALAARAAGIAPPEPWEIYAEAHNFGQMETEALEILTNHDSETALEIVINKIRRLALLRYGKVLAMLAILFLPGCAVDSVGVNYDAASNTFKVSASVPIKPSK